jgi:hypothetical protein
MKKSIIILLVLFIGSIGYSQSKNKIKGNREVVSIAMDLDKNFNALEIDDNITVSISHGNKNSYVLNTDENLVDEVQFLVVNNVLKIFTSKKISSFKKLEVNLKVSGIDQIILKDDAIIKSDRKLSFDNILIDGNNSSKFDMEIETDELQINMRKNAGGKISLKAKNLQIEMEDRSDLKGKINTDNLKVSLKNKAQLTLSGDSKHSEFRLANSADLDAKKMDSGTAVLFSSNSSDVYIRVSRKLEVTSDGRSKIYVYGKADVQLKGFTDKSKIIKK